MTALDPLAEAPPAFSTEQAARFLAKHWGRRGAISPLASERDWNARVGDIVLKVQNPRDGEAVIDFQNQALLHVARVDPDLPVMRLVPARDGRLAVPVVLADGRRSLGRVLTAMPGRLAAPEEIDAPAARAWGATAARMGRALRGLFHPAAGYAIQWDIRQLPQLRPVLGAIEDAHARDLVSAVLDRYEALVAPAVGALRHQVIHNDMGPGNVLVDDRRRVSGIIDLGDMTHTALVCDLAVILADGLEGRPDLLEMAGPMIAGYQSITPLEPEEARLLGDLVAARAATAVAIAAWRGARHPHHLSSTDRDPAAGALRSLEILAAAGWDEAAAEIGRLATDAALPYRAVPTGELLRRRRAVLGPATLSYREPVHLRSGEGVWLVGADGRRYLDAYNNVPVVGHAHPGVAAAVAEQLRRLDTNSRYLHEAAVVLAERLLPTFAGDFDRLLLVNSGSEANDLARRIAAFVTGGTGAVVTANAYHGVTAATTALSPEGWPDGYRPAGTGLVPAPPASRDELDRVLAGVRPGAAFIDCSFTSDGILGPAPEYVRDLAATTRAAGGLVVADEVQAGYGRTGDHLWSHAACGLEPDLVTLGKPMGNGFPVAAVAARSEHVDRFVEDTDYFSTFGGNQAACVAALAVLDVIEREDLVARAAEVGRHLRSNLESLGYPVRAWGLLAGVVLPGPAAPVAEAMRQRGVLVGTTGPAGDVLKIRPPLVFEAEHADRLLEALTASLGNGTVPEP